MKGKIKKGLVLGIGLASLAKREAAKHTKKLVKEGTLHSKKAKVILRKVAAEAKREGVKIERFLAAEIKKELKKAAPAIKKAAGKAKSKAKKKAKKVARKVKSKAKRKK